MKRNSQPDQEIKQYLCAVKSQLTCPYKEKKRFLKQMQNSLEIYATDQGQVSIEDLVREFGTPQEISDAFLQDESPSSLHRRLSFRRAVLGVIVFFTAILVISLIVLGTIYVVDSFSFTHGYYVDTVAEGTPPPQEGVIDTY